MLKFITLICSLCFSLQLLAQEGISTENNLGIEDLVKNVFVKGNCRNVSNINAIGDQELSIGQFKNSTDVINVSDGIILSTGLFNLAQGPNIDNESGYSFNNESSDPDLSQLATSNLFDVTGIEFDFIPFDDKVTFRYVFASEEYCEFVGTSFNDVFGFFVSGPGINGSFDNNAINVATFITLNGLTESVSINNVNHINNETFYVNNITTTDAQNCKIPYIPMAQDLIEYDGFTIPLIASFDVIPCESYHIRLVLGDVGDPNLDSAVFLETNSFDLGEKVRIHAQVLGSEDPTAFESCVDGQFVFTRNSLSQINEDCTVEYNISPDSEAINGDDFTEIPLSITIPAGDTNFILPINVIEDNITEGIENLKLELVYDCDCIDPILSELFINEVPELSVNFEEITICSDQVFSITPEVMGGVPPYDFLWETGVNTDTLTSSLSESVQLTVTVSDFCGSYSLGIADIGIQNIPSVTLMGTYDLCEISGIGIPIELQGNPPWKIEYSINNIDQSPIENIQTTPFYLNAVTEGTYELTAFSDAYCTGSFVGSATVEYSTFNVETDIVPPSCFNSLDGSILITQLEAIPPFSISWNMEIDDNYILENLEAGNYTLNIIDGNDCIYEKEFDLNAISNNINDCLPLYVPNIFSPNDDGINDTFSIFYDVSSGIESIVSIQIYNRWGGLIFEKNNFTLDSGTAIWNGDFKGKPLNTGVFVYKIMIAFKDGSTSIMSGDITVLR